MKRFIWIIAILVIGGLVAFAYFLYTKKSPDYADRDPQFILKAGELLSAYEKNPKQAAATYGDKIVRVSGSVKMIDTSGSLVITGDQPFSEIIVALDPRNKASLHDQLTGNMITVQGVCSSYSGASSETGDMLSELGSTLRVHSAGIK